MYKDAVYFSMHKFVGGVQTPGVLIAKRVLFRAGECYPDGCGGGSVCFVSRKNQVYLQVCFPSEKLKSSERDEALFYEDINVFNLIVIYTNIRNRNIVVG